MIRFGARRGLELPIGREPRPGTPSRIMGGSRSEKCRSDVSEILNNEEIDALLELFQAEGIPEDLAEAASILEKGMGPASLLDRVAPLDILKPNRFSRSQLIAIERIQDMVAKKIAAMITERLHVEADCDCVAVEQLAFSTWLGQLERPIAVYTLQIEPMQSPAVMTFSPGMLYGAVDCILGGSGVHLDAPKELSDAEYIVADAFVLPIQEQLAQGLSELGAMRFGVTGRFTNPNMAQVLPLGDVVLALHYQVTGQTMIGDIRLVIPYSALEAQLEEFAKSRFMGESQGLGDHRELLGRNISSVDVGLSVLLGNAEMKIGELLALQVGDIIQVDRKPGELLEVPVQDKTKFRGHLGLRGPRYAIDIREVLQES